MNSRVGFEPCKFNLLTTHLRVDNYYGARIYNLEEPAPIPSLLFSLLGPYNPLKSLFCMQRISQAFQQKAIATMASGGQPPSFRFYLHAQQTDGTRFLVELLADTTKVCVPSACFVFQKDYTGH
jgi:hypothetical protein